MFQLYDEIVCFKSAGLPLVLPAGLARQVWSLGVLRPAPEWRSSMF